MSFDGWYGALYDLGIQTRDSAPGAAFLMWGCDVRRVYRLMSEGIACSPGEVVLDVPTGGGVSFAAGAPSTRGLLVGADLSAGMLRRAARRRLQAGLEDHVRLVRADAGHLPFADASIDRVLCFNSLHCMPRRLHAAVLGEFRRVLRPAGELVGTTLVADPAGPWRLSVAAARATGIFEPPRSRELASQAGWAGFETWWQERSGALLYFHGE